MKVKGVATLDRWICRGDRGFDWLSAVPCAGVNGGAEGRLKAKRCGCASRKGFAETGLWGGESRASTALLPLSLPLSVFCVLFIYIDFRLPREQNVHFVGRNTGEKCACACG